MLIIGRIHVPKMLFFPLFTCFLFLGCLLFLLSEVYIKHNTKRRLFDVDFKLFFLWECNLIFIDSSTIDIGR